MCQDRFNKCDLCCNGYLGNCISFETFFLYFHFKDIFSNHDEKKRSEWFKFINFQVHHTSHEKSLINLLKRENVYKKLCIMIKSYDIPASDWKYTSLPRSPIKRLSHLCTAEKKVLMTLKIYSGKRRNEIVTFVTIAERLVEVVS